MRPSTLAALLFLSLSPGCGADDHDATHDAGGEFYDCAADERADVFAVGLTKTEGELAVELTAMDPAPPRKGMNAWSVKVTSGGEPALGLSLMVTPFMPDHGHGTTVTPVVTEGANGIYEIADVNLRMPGLWEVTIATTGETPMSVVFRSCISG